jgi:hypothetical protein
MHGLIRATHRRRQRASARRHFRRGWRAGVIRAAVIRAFTGAELYLDKRFSTLAKAADACGSNVHYVRAAITLIQDRTARCPTTVRDSVLVGHVPLLVAANQVRRRRKAERIPVDEAVAAWRAWTPEQRAEFGRGTGIAELWDDSIVPAMTEERVNQQAAK